MNVIVRNCKLENREHAIFISLDDLLKNGKVLKPNEKKGN